MNPAEKPRADSKLKNLPEDRQADIVDYAQTHSLADTISWLDSTGFKTSSPALSRFLSWYRLRQQLRHNQSAVQEVITAMAQDLTITPEQLYDTGQKFFLAQAIEKRDPRAWYLAQLVACRKAELNLQLLKYSDLAQQRKESRKYLLGNKTPGAVPPQLLNSLLKSMELLK